MFGPILCFVVAFLFCLVMALFCTMPFALKGEKLTTENVLIGLLSVSFFVLLFLVF